MKEQQWSSMAALKTSYQETIRKLEEYHEQLSGPGSDRKLVGEMISDCRYVVEWLSTGRRPGNRRGIERRAAYQREQLVDPVQMQRFVKPLAPGQAQLSEADQLLLDKVMSVLSTREKECYTMVHGSCFSLSEVSEMLGISKSSTALYIRRAQKKISVMMRPVQE